MINIYVFSAVSNYYYGAWWSGGLVLMSGLLGFFSFRRYPIRISNNLFSLLTIFSTSRGVVIACNTLSIISVGAAFAGLIVDSAGLTLMGTIEACVSAPDQFDFESFDYSGNSAYYQDASDCAELYYAEARDCYCVTGDAECYFFKLRDDVEDSCDIVTGSYRTNLYISVTCDLFCFLFVFALAVASGFSICCPRGFRRKKKGKEPEPELTPVQKRWADLRGAALNKDTLQTLANANATTPVQKRWADLRGAALNKDTLQTLANDNANTSQDPEKGDAGPEVLNPLADGRGMNPLALAARKQKEINFKAFEAEAEKNAMNPLVQNKAKGKLFDDDDASKEGTAEVGTLQRAMSAQIPHSSGHEAGDGLERSVSMQIPRSGGADDTAGRKGRALRSERKTRGEDGAATSPPPPPSSGVPTPAPPPVSASILDTSSSDDVFVPSSDILSPYIPSADIPSADDTPSSGIPDAPSSQAPAPPVCALETPSPPPAHPSSNAPPPPPPPAAAAAPRPPSIAAPPPPPHPPGPPGPPPPLPRPVSVSATSGDINRPPPPPGPTAGAPPPPSPPV